MGTTDHLPHVGQLYIIRGSINIGQFVKILPLGSLVVGTLISRYLEEEHDVA